MNEKIVSQMIIAYNAMKKLQSMTGNNFAQIAEILRDNEGVLTDIKDCQSALNSLKFQLSNKIM